MLIEVCDIFYPFLGSLLLGCPMKASTLSEQSKVLGFYHVLVFSGFHVHYWSRLVTKTTYFLMNGRMVKWVEGIRLLFLLLLIVGFRHGFPSYRAVLYLGVGLVLGYWRFESAWRRLASQLAVTGFLFWIDEGSVRQMGPWMSVVGSLMLCWGSEWLERGCVPTALLNVFVSIVEWHIALAFDIHYSLFSSIVFGAIYGVVLSTFFGWLLLFMVMTVPFPALSAIWDNILSVSVDAHGWWIRWVL